MHTAETLAREFNNEVVVPTHWHPPRFDRMDWQWIKNVAQASLTRDKAISNVQIGAGDAVRKLNCQHRTQPGRNCTIFYRRISDHTILLLGLGRHVGKSKTGYEVEWADGTSSRIELKTKRPNAPEFLGNPLDRDFAFQTLDPVLNAHHVRVAA